MLSSKTFCFQKQSNQSFKKVDVTLRRPPPVHPLSILYYCKSRLMLSLVNVISHLMWSRFKSLICSRLLNKNHRLMLSFGNVITFDMAKSDHIKRPLMYYLNGPSGLFKSALCFSWITKTRCSKGQTERETSRLTTGRNVSR